ncbi:hypothetical protein ETD83_09115 [Actinomadura soli]|uniref:Uncharacterized protein n=1 Tax=Actinomadura soli TaxID=2508997 RepID=A0A5C4JI38_9ACTN|nr:hypothetical protein [Actinomadura soli]TMR04231.1 hypothetical protein ETD83_09115 [Actinomadura soli]
MRTGDDDASAARLHKAGMASATYSLTVVQGLDRPLAVAAGLGDGLRHLLDFRLGGDHVGMLTEAGICSRATARSLCRVRFTGEVRAVPEGRVVLAGEPVLEVTAPHAVAFLVQAELLRRLRFQTAMASRAAGIVRAAGAARLIHRPESGREVRSPVEARSAVIGGFDATCDLDAARRAALPGAVLTDGLTAGFAADAGVVALLVESIGEADTDLVRSALAWVHSRRMRARVGVAVSGGDLMRRCVQARRRLDGAGMRYVPVFVGGRLDEHAIAALSASEAPIEGFVVDPAGAGAAGGDPEMVSRLVVHRGVPVLQPGSDPGLLPASKQVYRGERGDLLVTRGERCPAGHRPLLELVMLAGRPLRPSEPAAGPVSEARVRSRADLAWLRHAASTRDATFVAAPRTSPRLRALRDRVANAEPSALKASQV